MTTNKDNPESPPTYSPRIFVSVPVGDSEEARARFRERVKNAPPGVHYCCIGSSKDEKPPSLWEDIKDCFSP